MKSLTFSKNSWHYYLAKLAYDKPYDEVLSDVCPDICTYMRYVALGLFILLGMGVVIAAAGFILSHVILGIIFSLFYGVLMFTPEAIAALLLGTILGVGFLSHKLFKMRQEKLLSTEYRNRIRHDGFAKNAYKSWKEKFCVKVEFRE